MSTQGKQSNLQPEFLQQLVAQQSRVVIYLVNGIKLKGYLLEFSNESLLLDNGHRPQLIYIHAVASLLPDF